MRVTFLPNMSNLFTVTTRIRGAKLIDKDLVAFYLDLQTGHKTFERLHIKYILPCNALKCHTHTQDARLARIVEGGPAIFDCTAIKT